MNQFRIRIVRRLLTAAVFALSIAPSSASAQSASAWPTRPVKFVVAFPPGTPGDLTARAMAPHLLERFGQPVAVENRPGAAGIVAGQAVANSDPDGYTMLTGPDTLLTVNPHLYAKPGYNEKSLRPIMTIGTLSMILTCHPSTGVKSIEDLSALSKSRQLNYASGGKGVPGHLVMELFMQATGIRMTHVPYKGPAPAAADLLSGQVDCGFLSSNQVAPHLASGKLIGLAASGRQRSMLVPNMPTLGEIGLPSFDGTFAEMVYVPGNVPPAIVERLHRDLAGALATEPVKEALRQQDVRLVVDTPDAAAARIAQESTRWAALIKRLGLSLD